MNLGKTYRLSTWLRHIFMFHKEKVFRKLAPIMIAITLYTLVLLYLDKTSVYFAKIEHASLGQFHLIFGFILGILITFRINTVYSRWWEGRVLWGAIVNNCRNLALKFESFVGLQEAPQFYEQLRVLPLILKFHLRGNTNAINDELTKINLNPKETHPLLLVMNEMYRTINQLRNENKLRFEQYTALDTHLVNLIDMFGGCERITKTPMPPIFPFFIKQALLFYALIFPFGWIDQFGYLIVPMILMIIYVLLGLEMVAEELEDPFGMDDNDLSLDSIVKNITGNITDIAKYTHRL